MFTLEKSSSMGIEYSGQVCRATYFCMRLDSAVLIVLLILSPFNQEQTVCSRRIVYS